MILIDIKASTLLCSIFIFFFLVRTGKYRSGDEKKSKIPLEGIFETLSDFIDSLMKEKDFEGI